MLASTHENFQPWRMWSAAWMVTAVFILSNTATPLYVRWQREMGFSACMLTVIFAAYILGLLAALLVADQLSDRFGRKPVLLPALATAIAACLLFATASSVIALLVGRFLTGLSVGVIVSAGMASVVDLGGLQRKQLASLAASAAIVLGAGLGPMLAGTLAEVLPQPIVPIFAIELGGLVSAVFVAGTLPLKQTRPHSEECPRSCLPAVPHRNRRHLIFAIAAFAPGLTATSFVLSLGPSLLSDLLRVTSPLVAGGMACVMFLTATGIQLAVKRLSVNAIFQIGAAATIFSMISIAIAVNASYAVLLVVAAVLAGAGLGLSQLGGLMLIASHVPAHRRAEANTVFNIGGYIPAGLLPVGAGYLIDLTDLAVGATAFAGVLAITAAIAGLFVRRNLANQ